MQFALEMDTGRYSESISPVILFVVRLTVRLEGYMLFLILHHHWRREEKRKVNGCGWACHVRGLETTDGAYHFGADSSMHTTHTHSQTYAHK